MENSITCLSDICCHSSTATACLSIMSSLLTCAEFDSYLNSIIMDYLISEGYPSAAQKFASEANLQPTSAAESIHERVKIRDAIYAGDIQTAIERINELDESVLSPFPEAILPILLFAMIRLCSCTTHTPNAVLMRKKTPTTSVFSLSNVHCDRPVQDVRSVKLLGLTIRNSSSRKTAPFTLPSYASNSSNSSAKPARIPTTTSWKPSNSPPIT